jgi:hypothetical protein
MVRTELLCQTNSGGDWTCAEKRSTSIWRPLPTLPRHIVEAIEAGLDDLRHGRSVEGAVGLASIDKRLADWRAKQKNDAEPDEVRDTL